MLSEVRQRLKKLFSDRKLIIISHDKVSNLPISARTQVMGIACFMGIFCWMAYSTGTYFAYKEVLRHKDLEMASVAGQNRTLAERYAVLQSDILRLADDEESHNAYDAFIIKQYTSDDEEENGKLAERLAFLEERLIQMERQRDSFLKDLEKHTHIAVKDLKKVISMTGMRIDQLIRHIPNVQRNASLNTSSRAPEKEDFSHQGGPFIEDSEVSDLLSGPSLDPMIDTGVVDNIQQIVLLSKALQHMPLASPMRGYRVSSHFGRRIDPVTRRRAVHYGMDFTGPYGSKVMSTAPGRVMFAGRKGAYGYCVDVDHGFGFVTRYGHLRKITVRKGQQVARGDTVGIQGNTGRSTGTHLHYEVRFEGRALDPRKFLQTGQYVFQKS